MMQNLENEKEDDRNWLLTMDTKIIREEIGERET